jgi:hypothetical protein
MAGYTMPVEPPGWFCSTIKRKRACCPYSAGKLSSPLGH